MHWTCNSESWGGIPGIAEGVRFARRLIPYVARDDVRSWLQKHPNGQDYVIYCFRRDLDWMRDPPEKTHPQIGGHTVPANCWDDLGIKPGEAGYGDFFWLCGGLLYNHPNTEKLGITIFHEWLHLLPLEHPIQDRPDNEAEAISQQAYRAYKRVAGK